MTYAGCGGALPLCSLVGVCACVEGGGGGGGMLYGYGHAGYASPFVGGIGGGYQG